MAVSVQFVLGLFLSINVISSPASTPALEAAQPETLAGYPEVRIRKLHLVRPDLIHFPISSEIVC